MLAAFALLKVLCPSRSRAVPKGLVKTCFTVSKDMLFDPAMCNGAFIVQGY